ncbi:hypothetical protein K3U93_16015 [Mycobacterium malmoense]|uniref:PE-PGRS family protein n=1 Tax=Mycobacterium malmoense TaxID=1780 RepID=A0ABX3SSZ6_MYCMA|nr:hypothetical protein [Mycobacterium malmoense]ORA83173.1 hypothetical protein BST29_09810 [Mycobacterium malmoense]QZA16200.1 hypothetical protein K3U93_16015 [Mycobacterium malmoense]UNB93009.1 hypothetical protein H5T25_16005 [Mycobacterium malmoense]
MQQPTALRPLVTAGAAAVGASLIALTPTVSNDVASDLQRSAVTIQQRAVELTDDVVNPLQTWLDVFTTAGTNLQTIFNAATKIPLPVLQQLAANGVDYASIYVGAYQTAATAAAEFYGGTASNDFFPMLAGVATALQEPNYPTAFEGLANALWADPMIEIFQPLENILDIPTDISQNFANLVAFLDYRFLAIIGGFFIWLMPDSLAQGFGESVQATYDAFSSGNLMGGLTNLVNLPGAFAQQFINGVPETPGILTPTIGLLSYSVDLIPQTMAGDIVAPGATNIAEGGSLSAAIQAFFTQATTGWPQEWPSLQFIVDNFATILRSFWGATTATSAANVTGVADFATAASAAGALSADIAGLAPSIAADLSGIAPSIATNIAGTLAPEFGTLAAHLLTSLF